MKNQSADTEVVLGLGGEDSCKESAGEPSQEMTVEDKGPEKRESSAMHR